MGSWHVTGDQSNAGGVVGSVATPGTGDEVFLAAQEAAQAHRDSQGRLSGFMFHLPPAPRNNRHSHNLLQIIRIRVICIADKMQILNKFMAM